MQVPGAAGGFATALIAGSNSHVKKTDRDVASQALVQEWVRCYYGKMKRLWVLVLPFLAFQNLPAENAVIAYSELSLQATTAAQVRLSFTQHFRFPFLQGDSPLTENNNVHVSLGAEVSPVTLGASSAVVWTPIAFFELSAGGSIASGWNMNIMGDNAYGIGLNLPDAEGNWQNSGSAFDGAHWNARGGAALQASLAAFFPGEWNHVIVRTYHQFSHRGYSRASAGQSWFFQNDDGENRNGFYFYGNFILGYQMPLVLSMVGLIAEAELFLSDSSHERRLWGGDKIYWVFSTLFHFSPAPQFGISFFVQFHTQRNFLEPDWRDLYYRNRTLDNSNPVRLQFHRVAAVFSYRF